MDLRSQLLSEHSKKNCEKIVDWIGNDQTRFDKLFNLFLESESIITQRAAWPMSYSVIAHPAFMENNFEALLNNLKKPGIHNAIKRNTVRLLEKISIPEKYEGEIMDLCFSYVTSPSEAVAVKAFSLTILWNLAQKYPEIIPELKLVIEEQIPYQTAAFTGRAKKIVNSLERKKPATRIADQEGSSLF